MEGLIKLWQQTGIKVANMLSSKQVTNRKGDIAKIDRTIDVTVEEGSHIQSGEGDGKQGIGRLDRPGNHPADAEEAPGSFEANRTGNVHVCAGGRGNT